MALLVSLLVACGEAVPEPREPAEFGEACGEDGPFRVFTAGPGMALARYPLGIGGRVLLSVGRLEAEKNEDLTPDIEDQHVWSVGPCGESPVQLDASIDDLFVRDRWPDLLLARQGEDIVTVDPLGAEAPHVVFADIGKSIWTDAGVVSAKEQDDGTWTLRLHPYPADPTGETATGTDIYTTPKEPLQWQVSGDVVWVLTVDHALVRVGLTDGESTLVAAPVRVFYVLGDYLVWQHLSQTNLDPYAPTGQVFVIDLGDGSQEFLADGSLEGSGIELFYLGPERMQLNMGPDHNGPIRMYALSTRTYIDLPAERWAFRALDDGRLLLTPRGYFDFELFDPTDGTRTPLLGGDPLDVRADGIDVRDVPIGTFARDPAPVYRAQFDGSPPRLLGELSRESRPLTDGRYLTAVDFVDHLASIALFDPDDGSFAEIDEQVHPYRMWFNSAFGENVVVYSVDDGERSGVWLARVD